jgi:hypothetical protein
MDTDKIMCPSSRAKAGAGLLGVRQEGGTVAILPKPLPVDSHFIEMASQGGKPEERFRFTNKCIENGCRQWDGKSCGIAEQIVSHLDKIKPVTDLPECAIRPRCRWHLQSGDDACRICIYVVTEITEEEIETHKEGLKLALHGADTI